MWTNWLDPAFLNTVHCMDCLEFIKALPDNSIDSIVTDPPYWLSFMGKKWDYDVPSQKIREECLRILKPWGYLLAFAGTRTQHRMAVRIEDAGFEIRDIIAWVYGSGFPKSLNIGKAVDKLQGNEREDLWYNPNGRQNCEWKQMDTMWWKMQWSNISKWTSEREWRWTALKPSLEPITVARKPLGEKTVAENVLKWGTGGINIDGCRVGTEDKMSYSSSKKEWVTQFGTWTTEQNINGRFPANFIHDWSDEVVGLFPDTGKSKGVITNNGTIWGSNNEDEREKGYTDSGSASRFFYVAKASKSERNKWLNGFDEKQRYWTKNAWELNQFSWKYWTEEWKKKNPHNPQSNHHPTVKPVKLMQYLVRLVTAKWWVCLDPFTWSWTTGIACKLELVNFVWMDREQEYVDIANARIDARELEKEEVNPQPSLFDTQLLEA